MAAAFALIGPTAVRGAQVEQVSGSAMPDGVCLSLRDGEIHVVLDVEGRRVLSVHASKRIEVGR